MKKLIFAAFLATGNVLSAATLDGLAAKVNDAVITVGDVRAELFRIRGRTENAHEPITAVYSNAVNALIDRRLILAQAAARKIDMQEWLVDNRIREIAKESFEGDMNKLRASLNRGRISETDWRNQIRDDMIVNGMRFQMVEKDIMPSPSAMRTEYKTHSDRYAQDASVTVSVILLRPSVDNKTPSVTARGEDILARLARGEDFAALARQNSADSHAKDGGVWKDIKPEEAFRPEIAETIEKLKIGEFSKLVNLDGWGFIVRKDSETKAKALSFTEAYDKILSQLRKEEGKRRYDDWIRRLRAEAFIHIYPMPDDK